MESILEHHQQELGEAGESFHGQEDSDNLASARQLWSSGGKREREREREGIITVELSKERTYFSMEDEDVKECIEEQDPISHDTV